MIDNIVGGSSMMPHKQGVPGFSFGAITSQVAHSHYERASKHAFKTGGLMRETFNHSTGGYYSGTAGMAQSQN